MAVLKSDSAVWSLEHAEDWRLACLQLLVWGKGFGALLVFLTADCCWCGLQKRLGWLVFCCKGCAEVVLSGLLEWPWADVARMLMVLIPQFLGSLTSLTYLNLSSTGFMGPIPPQLGSLLYLDIGRNDYLYIANDVKWISHFSSIEFLDMTYVNLSRASNNWLQMMNMPPSLSTLHLSLCFLRWLSSLSSIVSLDLSYNRIPGLLPPLLRNLTTLRFLNLVYNPFNSAIPKWLYDMTSLQILDLKYNNFQGSISRAFANLTSLTELQLSSNYFEGRIPRSLGNLCNLRILGLSLNQLSGDISEFFGDHSSNLCIKEMLESLNFGANSCVYKEIIILEEVKLSSNLFNGSIQETLGSLSKLEGVFISNNSFEDTVSEVHFANLTRPEYFVADSNQLTLKISRNWIPPFQLREISMSSSDGGPQLFPAWLQT
ncbi:receptor-like protein EIX1 [Malania oleifera]|uniref:receptor-like protein EIX1 n=1 Tax=Malania oleifera TaxID=397392 RepID=UPI0025AE1CF3|nr:receptor-like protein EIX1 [Malania oleifera]